MSFQVGDMVGDYEIIGILGAGGMGKVYKVKNQISDRVDAMKVLLPNLADDQELADRFIREIKVLASLNHPNIAGLRTAFRLENQLLMVMEFVEGTSLDERTKAGPIPLENAISYIQQALAALGYAHQHGVIHRDIKPANMMLTPEDVIKLMDFGIAKSKKDKKLTQTGTTMGSLFYMSAEQVQGNELDGRSDLYSIGVSLYEMVTGKRPFSGKSDFDIMIAQLQQTPQAPIQMMPHLPRALNDIIMKSLEKDPANRFQTAEAFSAALGGLAGALNATPVQAAGGGTMLASVPPGLGATAAQQSATGMMSSQAGPGPMPSQPTAVGGSLPSPGGYIPTANVPTVMAPQPPVATANTPTVMAPQPSAPAMGTMPPPDPSHGIPAAGGSKGNRGLYMALGALIVVAILAVAALQVPRFLKAHASGDQGTQTASNTPNSAAPANSTSGASTPPAAGEAPSSSASNAGAPDANQPAGASNSGNTAGGAGNNASAPPGTSGSAPAAGSGMVSASSSVNRGANGMPGTNTTKNRGAAINSPAAGGQSGAAPASAGTNQVVQEPPANNGASAQELAELDDLHDKLSVRAGTVVQRVEAQRRQMASTGDNLRSDVSAAETRVKMNMDKFDAAMNAKDPEAAKKSMHAAERDIEFLEKFFNL